jgi:hypothetical protein
MAASQIVTFLTLEEQVVENIEVTAKIAAKDIFNWIDRQKKLLIGIGYYLALKDNSFVSSAGWTPHQQTMCQQKLDGINLLWKVGMYMFLPHI